MTELGLYPLDRGKQKDHLQEQIIQLFKAAADIRPEEHMGGFPGTMPMTLSRRSIPVLLSHDYVLLEKSDGTRYLLFVYEGMSFLVDRRMLFFPVVPDPMVQFESIVSSPQGYGPHHMTLLDGELTLNHATHIYEYLVYDVVALHGDTSIAKKHFRERLSAVAYWISIPRALSPNTAGLLRIRVKDYYEKDEIKALFAHISKDKDGEYVYTNSDRIDGTICNLNDGVIFTPVLLPYQIKTCHALLKWKPPHLNSVDFLLDLERIQAGSDVKCKIKYKGDRGNVDYREVHFPSAVRKMFLEHFNYYNQSIAEMSYDVGAGEWKYIRQRPDKIHPNYSSTVMDTLESTAECIRREEIIDRLGKVPIPPQLKQPRPWSMDTLLLKPRTNDLFDEDNEAYKETTPVSLIAPPYIPERRNKKRPVPS